MTIESFQLGDFQNRDIKYLNRNFNNHPQPPDMPDRVKDQGLPMPIAVKDGFLYFQPVQGDINFLVNTAFFRRLEMRPIPNLKSPATLPLAINRMSAQDRQPGFRNLSGGVPGGNHESAPENVYRRREPGGDSGGHRRRRPY